MIFKKNIGTNYTQNHIDSLEKKIKTLEAKYEDLKEKHEYLIKLVKREFDL